MTTGEWLAVAGVGLTLCLHGGTSVWFLSRLAARVKALKETFHKDVERLEKVGTVLSQQISKAVDAIQDNQLANATLEARWEAHEQRIDRLETSLIAVK